MEAAAIDTDAPAAPLVPASVVAAAVTEPVQVQKLTEKQSWHCGLHTQRRPGIQWQWTEAIGGSCAEDPTLCNSGYGGFVRQLAFACNIE